MRTVVPVAPPSKYLILDLGAFNIKAGISGEGYPRLFLPSVVGYHQPPDEDGADRGLPLLAEEAIYSGEPLYFVHPFMKTADRPEWDWQAVTELLVHVYDKLAIDPSEYFVFYIEPVDAPPAQTQRLIQLLKEEFFAPQVFSYPENELVLHGMYRKSAVVLDLGHNTSSCIAYFKGFKLTPSFSTTHVAGKMLVEHFQQIVGEQLGKEVSLYELVPLLRKYFYIANNYERESEFYDRGFLEDVTTSLPTMGQEVKLGPERFRIPEMLLQPTLFEKEGTGLAELIHNVVQKCAIDTRATILEAVVLSGGVSQLKGLEVRLRDELRKHYPNLMISVVSHQQRECTSWIGADSLCQRGLPPSISK